MKSKDQINYLRVLGLGFGIASIGIIIALIGFLIFGNKL